MNKCPGTVSVRVATDPEPGPGVAGLVPVAGVRRGLGGTGRWYAVLPRHCMEYLPGQWGGRPMWPMFGVSGFCGPTTSQEPNEQNAGSHPPKGQISSLISHETAGRSLGIQSYLLRYGGTGVAVEGPVVPSVRYDWIPRG